VHEPYYNEKGGAGEQAQDHAVKANHLSRYIMMDEIAKDRCADDSKNNISHHD
jgi:hypothetical protein